jgi:peptidoglycan/xylan/chitin deacetylase (PgdA/CDA1 family)
LTFADLSERHNREGVRPPLILSFDDGYRDFIEVTAPILARHRIRVNHNIIPTCVETGTQPLNVMVQDFIGKGTPAELSRLEIEGCPLDSTSSSRAVLGFRVSHYLKNRPEAELKCFRAAVFDQVGEYLLRYATPMMDLAAFKELSALHELGAHSYSHASLGFESDAYVSDDFQRCKAWFSEQLNIAVNVFAFPNGSYADHHIPLATAAGFEHILLVNVRFSNTKNCVHDRFGFDARNAGEMRYKAVGRLTEI